MNAKTPSQAWIILMSMIEDGHSNEHSNYARENAEKEFESLDMIAGESARENAARAKELDRAEEYHFPSNSEGLPSSMHSVREMFALKYTFSLVELEQALVNVEALYKRQNGADGHALAAGFRRNQIG